MEAARKAAVTAEKVLAELETAIPKAQMESQAALEQAEDLRRRLSDLEAATKVRLTYEFPHLRL